ncbi:aspartic peptidase domain-containing protein [Mycena crocata]|nr:aspartic peptidase domain-containing protein [Mycena crocata]
MSADPKFDTTGSVPVSAGYGRGNLTGISGFARMELGDYSFSKQAFFNITSIGGNLGIGQFGIDGILGLGFADIEFSPLSTALKGSAGQPFLFNVFDMHPTETNLIGIALSRTDDLEGSAEESFTIVEIDENFADVTNRTPVPLFPGDTGRWSVVVDRITVDGVDLPLVSNVKKTPKGSLVAVIDSGTFKATLPPDLLYALYSQIPGASVEIEGEKMTFVIPYNTTSIVTMVIAGQPYPIHPLDLSDVLVLDDRNETGVYGSVCIGAFHAFPPQPDFDALFGDTFMRNIYSVFNFGNAASKAPTKDASMQLLSITDLREAIPDVRDVRMAQLADKAPEIQELLPGLVRVIPGSRPPTGNGSPHVASNAVTDADAPTSDDSNTNKYALIIIGLVSGNLVVVLILAVIGVALYVKRGRASGSPAQSSRYVPVRVREEESMKASEAYDADRRYSD